MSRRPLALVTGASSGIGADLARELAADGHDLVLVARSQAPLQDLAEELKAVHGVATTTVVADLAKHGAAADLAASIGGQGLVVDVLVNNAGLGAHGLFHELSLARIDEMMAVNMVALTELTRLLLPGMIARKSGLVLQVASTAAYQPGPAMAVYCASKSYVLSLTEAMSEELRGTGVSITALCPGPTRTNFDKVAKIEGSAAFKPGLTMTSVAVAKFGYAALKRGQRVAIPGTNNRIGALMSKFIPRSTLLPMVRKMMTPA